MQTAGKIPKFNSTTPGDLTDSVMTESTGFIGINTSSPYVPLTVNGRVALGSDGNPGGNVLVRIHGSAPAGADSTALFVSGSPTAGTNGTGLVGLYVAPGFAKSSFTGLNAYGIISGFASFTGTGTIDNSYAGYFNAFSGATNNYAAVFLSGNVGIGTGSPSEKLEVAGNIKVTGTAGVNGIIFPDGTKQTTACAPVGFSVSPAPRPMGASGLSTLMADRVQSEGPQTGTVTPLTDGSSAVVSLIATLREQQREISQLRAELEALKRTLQVSGANAIR